MAKEIERKFLVKSDDWKKGELLKKVVIKQGYISKGKGKAVRVRVTDDCAYITIKGGKKGITRDEFEYQIPKSDGEQLIKMSETPIVSKTRYYVRDERRQLWEVDVFKGTNRGLVVAEIELESARQTVSQPTWIGKEVTKDERYTNVYIAEHKVPKR